MGDPPASILELKRILAALDAYRRVTGPGSIDPTLASAGGPAAASMANPTGAGPVDAPASEAAPAAALEDAPETSHGP